MMIRHSPSWHQTGHLHSLQMDATFRQWLAILRPFVKVEGSSVFSHCLIKVSAFCSLVEKGIFEQRCVGFLRRSRTIARKGRCSLVVAGRPFLAAVFPDIS